MAPLPLLKKGPTDKKCRYFVPSCNYKVIFFKISSPPSSFHQKAPISSIKIAPSLILVSHPSVDKPNYQTFYEWYCITSLIRIVGCQCSVERKDLCWNPFWFFQTKLFKPKQVNWTVFVVFCYFLQFRCLTDQTFRLRFRHSKKIHIQNFKLSTQYLTHFCKFAMSHVFHTVMDIDFISC